MEQAARDFGMNWLLYRAWITQATIYYQDNQADIAMDIMAKLLEQTSQMVYGAIQIYLSTGEPARTLLLEARRHGIHLEHVSHLLAEFPPKAIPVKPNDLPESLTERELDVLHLMADGLKNQEIGARLFISLNTIRYHATNIFGKLGVDNRTAAVARARQMGLFDSKKK
jgi:LuxR family maltose regulon positive regulatory protein